MTIIALGGEGVLTLPRMASRAVSLSDGSSLFATGSCIIVCIAGLARKDTMGVSCERPSLELCAQQWACYQENSTDSVHPLGGADAELSLKNLIDKLYEQHRVQPEANVLSRGRSGRPVELTSQKVAGGRAASNAFRLGLTPVPKVHTIRIF